MEWTFKDDYTLRVVEKFDENQIGDLVKQLFYDNVPSIDYQEILSEQEKQRDAAFKSKVKDRYFLKIAAYHQDKFVGWTSGWQDTENRFLMGMSAVVPEHRRSGLYTQLASSVLRITKEEGFQSVCSHHFAGNNPVIIAKLKLGFVITGMEVLEWAGLMIKMMYFHHPVRADAYNFRVGMKHPSDLLKERLGYK